MLWFNTPYRYGSLSKSLHWLGAFLVLIMLFLGFYMTGLRLGLYRAKVFTWHESLGLLVFVTTLLRVFSGLFQTQPKAINTLPAVLINLARIVHMGFYVLLILMPITGVLMLSTLDLHAPFFHFFSIPPLISESDYWHDVLKKLHHILAYVFCCFLSGHIFFALIHHFYCKDNTLKRMLPFID